MLGLAIVLAIIILAASLTLSPGRAQIVGLFTKNTSTPVITFIAALPTPLLPTQTPTTQALIVLPTSRASNTPVPSPTATITPTPTPLLPTPGPGLATPFGPNQEYLLFLLQDGQSLGTLASRFNTTIDVLKAMNTAIIEGASVRPGTVLVIMPGVKDAANLPRFTIISTTTSKTLADLAQEYGVSVEDLKLYNNLSDADPIPANRWLLIPVVK